MFTPKKRNVKSKIHLELHSRALKKKKKHKGKASGSRFNLSLKKRLLLNELQEDARLGSRKPIDLTPTSPSHPKVSSTDSRPSKPLTHEQLMAEFTALEANDYLNELLDRAETGHTLNATEQRDLDAMLIRLETLMTELGIDVEALDDEEEEDDPTDDEPPYRDNIMHLIK